MASITEEISRLTNPNPVFRDPEDADDITSAQLVGRTDLDDVDDDDLPQTSTKLRRQAAKLLVEEDSRYAGKKTSRKRLKEESGAIAQESDDDESGSVASEEEEEEGDSDEEEDEEDENEEDDDEDEGEEEEEDLAIFKEKMKTALPKKENAEFSFEDDGDLSKFASDSDEEEESDSADEEETGSDDSEEDDEEEEEDEEEGEEGGISAFSKSRLDEEVKKGEAVRIQLNVWDQLLKARIELQKLLVLVNRLPQPDSWNHFTNQGGEEYNSGLKQAQNAMKSILDKVYILQTELIAQHSDTKHIVEDQKAPQGEEKKPVPTKEDDDDEEITSEEDEEKPDNDTSRSEPSPSRKRKRKHGLHEYPTLLTKRHKEYSPYRDDTIQKWFDKTKIASGKLSRGFSAFEQSALKQIKQVLSDRDRLIKRTQLRRSTYSILGEPEAVQVEEKNPDDEFLDSEAMRPGRENTKDYNEEIFDDDDFYHQLLRELIQRKTMDINDPIALSRQWLELQKLRSKVKKKVDTRASKGRKIRYHILPKLVNFMAPTETSSWTDEARDDLYRSLFGKRGSVETEVATSS